MGTMFYVDQGLSQGLQAPMALMLKTSSSDGAHGQNAGGCMKRPSLAVQLMSVPCVSEQLTTSMQVNQHDSTRVGRGQREG